jgi:cobalt/nickel transport system ATP-binding protein
MLFDLDRVTYRYQQVVALDQLTLQIPAHRRIALLGANGSGKSTLLRLLDGLYFPESGDVRFSGQPLTEDRFADDRFAFEFRRRVGLVFQNPDVQLFNATVFDEVAFAPLQLRWPKPEIRDRVDRTLELLRISHLRDRPPYRLSGGEKKRVSLASVLVVDPEVLLLDEPTAALDPRSQSQIIDFLVDWGSAGKSVIFATHDLETLEDIADEAYVLDRGTLAASGPPRTVLQNTELLARTNLIYLHKHRHSTGELHSHPHQHHHHDH